MRQQGMDIVFAVDDIYADAVTVAATSIRRGLREDSTDLRFHVIDCDLDPANRKHLDDTLGRIGDVRLYTVPGRIVLPRQKNYWTSAILARLHIGTALPEDVGRVVYLDADTLVLGDLTEFYGFDLRGRTLGATAFPGWKVPREWPDHPVLLERHPECAGKVIGYFNSGVLLIDLEKWRAGGITEQAVEIFQRYPDLRSPDQDVLNVIFADQWTELPPIWNKLIEHYKLGKFGKGRLDYLTRREGIIHYGGVLKPWHEEFPRDNPLRDIYEEYSRSM